jgi:hypothetical protein
MYNLFVNHVVFCFWIIFLIILVIVDVIAATFAIIEAKKINAKKALDPEYKEYLRLKAKFN